MDNKPFGVFIVSHGRPNNVKTLKALRVAGYSGDVHIVIDNEDKTADQYHKLHPNVIVFDKQAVADTIDEIVNFSERKSPVYARQYLVKAAKEMGYERYIICDDDYDYFPRRFIEKGMLREKQIKKGMTEIFEAIFLFLESTNFKMVAMTQNGDFMGGSETFIHKHKGLMKKCMNVFFCLTSRPVQWIGFMNEDVNTTVNGWKIGEMYCSILDVSINQADTQIHAGGVTEAYKKHGTYVKSFMSVIVQPSAVKINALSSLHPRIHHRVDWKHAAVQVISPKWKK